MIILRDDWNLRQWHDWLEKEMHLRIGEHYRWAWSDNHWAIEFTDPKLETAVRLKVRML